MRQKDTLYSRLLISLGRICARPYKIEGIGERVGARDHRVGWRNVPIHGECGANLYGIGSVPVGPRGINY